MTRSFSMRPWGSLLVVLMLAACDGNTSGADAGPSGGDAGPEPEFQLRVVTFNTGTTLGLAHDGPPADGYSMENAVTSDTHYGNGLAWTPAIDAARWFLATADPDVVVFQEVFHSDECESIPASARAGFVCDGWQAGDETVAQTILGSAYQVVCNLGKPDKCAAVRRTFGSFRGCDSALCLDGLDGARVPDCGGGSRIGRGVIDLVRGGSITVVNVHGSSGIEMGDQACRSAQFDQVFVDLDGSPAASGAMNIVMGDFNTDPVRLASGDTSAMRLVELIDGSDFDFVTRTERTAPSTYAGLFNIDHVISDGFSGDCWAAGVTDGHDPVIDAVYFDHVPIVCDLGGDQP